MHRPLSWLVPVFVWLQACDGAEATVARDARQAPSTQASGPGGLVGGGAGSSAPLSPVETSTAGSTDVSPTVMTLPSPSGGIQDVCARERYQADQTPLAIYTLFDESISMLPWWGPVTEAFTAFLRDPSSAGINIGLKFFGTECSPEAYSTPDVAIDRLPENAEPIASQLASRVPLAQTPTTQAIQGAELALRKYAGEHPEHKVALLLVTDASSGIGEGDPEDCYSTVAQAADAAASAHAATPSIATYVLGLGDGAGLNLLSQAGGTGEALIADPAASTMVADAIREIRRRALPCTFALPAEAALDPTLVNLERVDPHGETTTIVGVDGVRGCDPASGGWYYDDPESPTQIVSCQATCEALAGVEEVHVIVGCPTISPE